MKICYNLAKLNKVYNRKLDSLERKFTSVQFMINPIKDGKYVLSYCVIELMNSYRAFNRALLASSMIGAKTCLGNRVGLPRVNTEFDFIANTFPLVKKSVNHATRTWKSYDEPAWEAEINRLSLRLNLQNQKQIDNAFTISSFYKEIKIFRNFFCHRSRLLYEDTKVLGLQYLISCNSAEEALLVKTSGGDMLFYKWIGECRDYAYYSTE